MTFGREPNTFSYFAAHIQNNPSTYEGVQNIKKEIYSSVASHVNLYAQLFAGDQNNNDNYTKTASFTLIPTGHEAKNVFNSIF